VAKSKLRGSWGGKIEAQAELGVAKPNVRKVLGSTWDRSGGTLGGFWEVRGVRGGPLRNFGADLSFSFPGRTKDENLSIKSFPFGSAEIGDEYCFLTKNDEMFRPSWPGPGLSAARNLST